LQVISTPLLDRLIYALGAENEIVRNFLEQFLLPNQSECLKKWWRLIWRRHNSQMQNTRRWHFAGDLYFDLALYIQQLAVPSCYGALAQFHQRQSRTTAGAVEPASGSSF